MTVNKHNNLGSVGCKACNVGHVAYIFQNEIQVAGGTRRPKNVIILFMNKPTNCNIIGYIFSHHMHNITRPNPFNNLSKQVAQLEAFLTISEASIDFKKHILAGQYTKKLIKVF